MKMSIKLFFNFFYFYINLIFFQGDGGAPLACPVGNDRYKLAGLVAWGVGCGQKDVPAVYARVSMFRNWVDEVMDSWGYPTSSYTINK